MADPESTWDLPADEAPAPTDVDAPAVALNRARQAAQAAGFTAASASRRTRKFTGDGREEKPASRRRRRSTLDASQQGKDSRLIGAVFDRLVAERGWDEPVAVGSVLSRWPELVGPDIAAHAQVEEFDHAQVVIRCDSTAWATQLRLMTPTLLGQLEDKLGPGVVREIVVKGPSAPSWKKGPRSVRGRGPRDTYG
ncbi:MULTISPECIES: DUF721 domain-containing protein [Citricoccus]|uniref:DciA family protein n=1 Tax=Citricoccus muralis TaxID=169134 RepID=A0ABY8H6K7_9MICC|nr:MULTISPECIES: DciA family protein [Citricoccus]WBL19900.1 DciA family protein [Citricoccus sp. NR2]WFP16556.1 DciA family protein [Citricoccus muralis]